MTIWTLRSTIGQEKLIAKHIRKKIDGKEKIKIWSILIPEALRGYIFIESDSIENIDKAIQGLPHVRSKIVGEVNIKELEGFLVPKPTIEGLHINDIIEIISGPFKGSRAKINRIDMSREEVTVELLDSQIPIPIKLHSDFCKVIESAPVSEEVTTSTEETKTTSKTDKEEPRDIFAELTRPST